MTEKGDKTPGRASVKHLGPQAVALGLMLLVLVAGELGFRALRGWGWDDYTSQDGLVGGQVAAIAPGPDGAMWFGSRYGLSRFDGTAWTTWTEKDGLPDEDIRSISVSADGAVLLRTGQGFAHLVDGKWASYLRLDILVRHWRMFTMVEECEWPIAVASDGTLWFGTGSGALYLSESQGVGGVYPSWILYSKDKGLPDDAVLSVAVGPGGQVWAGTGRGAAQYDGQSWATYTRRNGLAHDRVIAVAVAPDGTAWFSTGRGLSRFDGQTWQTLPLAALGLRRSPKALAIDGQGRLWVETQDGVRAWDGRQGAPLWALKTWLFVRTVLIVALCALAAVLGLNSPWGRRLVRWAENRIRSGWNQLKGWSIETRTRLHNRARNLKPQDRLRHWVSRHCASLAWLASLVLVALVLRLWRLDFDRMLPYLAHADEQTQFNPAIRIIQTGDLNPHFFNYPSLTITIDALVLFIGYQVGLLLGVFDSVADLHLIGTMGFARGLVGNPGLLLLGRATTAVFGALTTGLLFVLVKPFTGRRWGAIAAAWLLLVSMEHIRLSHYMAVDVIATCFATACIACCVLSQSRRDSRFLWGAAILGGLATSSKYNYAILSIPVALSVMLDHRLWMNQQIKRVMACAILFCLAFVLTSPYVLLDFEASSEAIRYESQHYAQGHLGQTGSSFVWYTHYLWKDNPFYLLLGAPGMLIALWRKPRIAVPVALFGAIYFVLIGVQAVHMDRNVLPVMVLLIAASGITVEAILGWLPSRIREWRLGRGQRWLSPVAIGLMCIPLWPSVQRLPALLLPASPSGQAQAQAWFDRATEMPTSASLLSGLDIAAEGYTIYLDPQPHRIKYVTAISDIGTPEECAAQGYDIVLLGSGMFGRFYANPDAFAGQVEVYEAFLKGPLLERLDFESPGDPLSFVDGGGQVTVFFLTEQASQFKAEMEKH